jgi:hypothetical protein
MYQWGSASLLASVDELAGCQEAKKFYLALLIAGARYRKRSANLCFDEIAFTLCSV